jgi:hypothetical protein
MKITKRALKKYLKNTYQNQWERKKTLENWLVNYVCNRVGSNPELLLQDIAVNGCSSGVVSPLIYNSDCINFFQKYEANIWEIINEYTENTGQNLGDFMNSFTSPLEDEITFKVYLSWFAIEYLAYNILNFFEN